MKMFKNRINPIHAGGIDAAFAPGKFAFSCKVRIVIRIDFL
jgi:hypothetical protein